jgi:flagellar biosynthetic protein FliQ
MTDADVALALRAALFVTLKVGGPLLLTGLVVGLVISLLQAVTQIHESTLAFVPKVIAVGAVLMLMGPFMLTTLQDHARQIFAEMVVMGSR